MFALCGTRPSPRLVVVGMSHSFAVSVLQRGLVFVQHVQAEKKFLQQNADSPAQLIWTC